MFYPFSHRHTVDCKLNINKNEYSFFTIVVAIVTNISIQENCRDFVNKLFITKMFSAKRTLL